MNKLGLYPFCDKWLEKSGSIWIISDPHFNDADCFSFRSQSNNPPLPDGINNTVDLSNFLVNNINKCCGKNDTLIILGDIGDINYVKKLKAGYKVLITGNHDSGVTNYERVITKKKYIGHDKCPNCGSIVTYSGSGLNFMNEKEEYGWCANIDCLCRVKAIKQYTGEDSDNRLFDEVYKGKLQIRPDLILSHEPIEDKYSFNIHGHDHRFQLMKDKMAESNIDINNYITSQIELSKEVKNNQFNCCSEWLGYKPINLKQIIQSGLLKDILDIHRETIDIATSNPTKDKTKL